MVSGSSLFSSRNSTDTLTYQPPAERGGLYPGGGFERIFGNGFGYSAEVSTRYHQQLYNNYQRVRPLLYDFNAVMQKPLAKKFLGVYSLGIGGERNIFYYPYVNCGYGSGCPTHYSDSHFLFHAGAGIRYRVWRNFFVRPEANYYRIVNNTVDFHSDNVLRLGASVGYTFKRD